MRGRRVGVVALALAIAVGTPAPAPASAADECGRFGAGVSAGRVENNKLTEISGLVASRRHPGVYWAHNDSGGRAELSALTLAGRDLGSFGLPGATATDWEDLAVGPKAGGEGSFLYAGDIGDNSARRNRVTVFRVPEPAAAPTAPGRGLRGVERFDFAYPDGAQDAEAMLVDPISGDLVIVTKSIIGRSRIFVAPAKALVDGAKVVLRKAGTLQISPVVNPSSRFPGTFVTGADISPDGSLIVVRTYQAVLAFHRTAGQSVADALQDGSCNAPQVDERQGEAIAIAADGSRYVTISEGSRPVVHAFAISASSPATEATSPAPTPAPAEEPTITDRIRARTGDEVAVAAVAAGVAFALVVLRRRRRRRRRRRV